MSSPDAEKEAAGPSFPPPRRPEPNAPYRARIAPSPPWGEPIDAAPQRVLVVRPDPPETRGRLSFPLDASTSPRPSAGPLAFVWDFLLREPLVAALAFVVLLCTYLFKSLVALAAPWSMFE